MIDAIISGIRDGLPYSGEIVGRAFRYVSEVIHRDRYYPHAPKPHYNSTAAKMWNPLISRRAAALVGTMPFETFKTLEHTRLEHSLPLKQVYAYLQDCYYRTGDLDPLSIVGFLHMGPLVTITAKEDSWLKDDISHAVEIERYAVERYSDARNRDPFHVGIEVGRLDNIERCWTAGCPDMRQSLVGETTAATAAAVPDLPWRPEPDFIHGPLWDGDIA